MPPFPQSYSSPQSLFFSESPLLTAFLPQRILFHPGSFPGPPQRTPGWLETGCKQAQTEMALEPADPELPLQALTGFSEAWNFLGWGWQLGQWMLMASVSCLEQVQGNSGSIPPPQVLREGAQGNVELPS